MRYRSTKRAHDFSKGILAIGWLAMGICASGCKSDTVCPGHFDPCNGPYCYPNFTIKTSDGSRAITSAHAVSGDCAVDTVAIPDGGFERVATVLVYGGSYPCSSPPCTVQLTLRDGRTAEIVAEMHQGSDVTYRHCAKNTNCCDRSEYSEVTVPSCYWSPWESEVDMTSGSEDGGLMD